MVLFLRKITFLTVSSLSCISPLLFLRKIDFFILVFFGKDLLFCIGESLFTLFASLTHAYHYLMTLIK